MDRNLETAFTAANLFVLPFWFLMIVLPGWRWTRRVMALPVVLAVLPALYVGLVLPRLGGLLPALAGPPDALQIAKLLSTPDGAVIAWVHFLAFDLFVGRFIYLDTRDQPVPWFVTAPTLLLTLMFGPAGLLVYLVVRGLYRVRERRKAKKQSRLVSET